MLEAITRPVGSVVPAAPAQRRDDNRQRLRTLDLCLSELEERHERDEVDVSAELATRIGRHVPGIRPGMAIASAIDQVFRMQRQYLGGDAKTAPAVAEEPPVATGVLLQAGDDTPHAPLQEQEARLLTERIRVATQHVCLLLLEAHSLKAWHALGYGTWDQYVHREFGLSRSRSYELLDQGRVIKTLQAAADLTEVPDVSAYVAGQIKPHLGEIVDVVRRRLAESGGENAMEVTLQVVKETRVSLVPRRSLTLPRRITGGSVSPEQAMQLIELLAAMPPSLDITAVVAGERRLNIETVARAVRWLTSLARTMKECGPPLLNVG